jgi:hypothetical protein
LLELAKGNFSRPAHQLQVAKTSTEQNHERHHHYQS